jgi:TrmH family RNA methyltransferase
MDLITSRSNSKIKAVRSLRQSKARRESGLFLVEGIRHVGEAAASGMSGSGYQVDAIFYAPDLLSSDFAQDLIEDQISHGVACYATSADVFNSIADKQNPQGILALVRPPDLRLDDLNPQNFSWGVALVAPQDPGNIGTILRTIDAVGASGLLLLEGGADPYHPHAVRASMGALFWYPVIQASFAGFVGWAGQLGYTIYGTSAHADQDYRSARGYRLPGILLMGSEREGLTPDQVQACQELLRLPMHGRVTSLNLAVATGVMLYAMSERINQEP